jgi:hypothetical protein
MIPTTIPVTPSKTFSTILKNSFHCPLSLTDQEIYFFMEKPKLQLRSHAKAWSTVTDGAEGEPNHWPDSILSLSGSILLL